MPSVSWVTVVWSMIASASLTLGAVYCGVWFRDRSARAHLLFSVTAFSLTAFTFCEFWIMRSASPGELLTALKWAQGSLLVLLVSLIWLVATYLQAGRHWLAWTATGLRLVFVLANSFGTGLNFTQMSELRQVRFLGEPVTILAGVTNPATLIGQLSIVLILAFVADATATAWRRGDRRKAVAMGGSVLFFLLTGLVTSMLVIWGQVEAPIVFSLLYIGLVAVIGHELSVDVLRASQLVKELRRTEAGLREHQVKLEASRDQISATLRRLIVAQETERTRIARELHDGVSQRIASMALMISGVKRGVQAGSEQPQVLEGLRSLQTNAVALGQEIRHVSHELHPVVLQHTGLPAALRGLCAEFERLHEIRVSYTATPDVEDLSPDAALSLFRIAQEALRNIAKHAQARHVVVTLSRETAAVRLVITDDGKGFDIDMARRGSSLGLVSMDERARLIEGLVEIESHPRTGTRLQASIPYAGPAGQIALRGG